MHATELSLFPTTPQFAPQATVVEPVNPLVQPQVNSELIKAITLHNPWAWLIGRHKFYETRDWSTDYRGKLAIHSASKSNKEQAEMVTWAYQNIPKLLPPIENLVYGSVVAIADLTDCIRMTEPFIKKQSKSEIKSGHWEVGRYAWKLENIEILQKPIQARGGRSLWDWEWMKPVVVPKPPEVIQPSKAVLIGHDGMPFKKPRYTWADAGSLAKWWNPFGEQINKEFTVNGVEYVTLDYGGIPILKSDLIEIDPAKVAEKNGYSTVVDNKTVPVSGLLGG